jgi:O-methyltransferase
MFSTDVNGTVVTYEDIDDPYFMSIYPTIKPHTITSSFGPVPLWVLYKTIEHIVKHDVPGDIAECGVWNGGSMLLTALALKHYDTYAGMVKPEDIDKRWDGVPALPTWENAQAKGPTWENAQAKGTNWGYGGTVEMVLAVMRSSGYPEDKFVFVEGMVENTIPGTMAERLSLLRLDTDLYRSTYHELVHLYPTLSSGGILILDDYGYFQGARAATDQYIAENKLKIFLSRIDYSIRLAVKP